MAIFTNKTIHKRVMAHVMRKIEMAQKTFDNHCKEADAICKLEHEDVDAKHARAKEEMADKLVQEVIGSVR